MSEKPTETVWITKYAIGGKVLKAECEIRGDGYARLVRRPGAVNIWGLFSGEGKEWHRTRESAQRRVTEMVEAKRKSIAKQLAKLDKPIEVPE
jgi:hypothetical protein